MNCRHNRYVFKSAYTSTSTALSGLRKLSLAVFRSGHVVYADHVLLKSLVTVSARATKTVPSSAGHLCVSLSVWVNCSYVSAPPTPWHK